MPLICAKCGKAWGVVGSPGMCSKCGKTSYPVMSNTVLPDNIPTPIAPLPALAISATFYPSVTCNLCGKRFTGTTKDDAWERLIGHRKYVHPESKRW